MSPSADGRSTDVEAMGEFRHNAIVLVVLFCWEPYNASQQGGAV